MAALCLLEVSAPTAANTMRRLEIQDLHLDLRVFLERAGDPPLCKSAGCCCCCSAAGTDTAACGRKPVESCFGFLQTTKDWLLLEGLHQQQQQLLLLLKSRAESSCFLPAEASNDGASPKSQPSNSMRPLSFSKMEKCDWTCFVWHTSTQLL